MSSFGYFVHDHFLSLDDVSISFVVDFPKFYWNMPRFVHAFLQILNCLAIILMWFDIYFLILWNAQLIFYYFHFLSDSDYMNGIFTYIFLITYSLCQSFSVCLSYWCPFPLLEQLYLLFFYVQSLFYLCI